MGVLSQLRAGTPAPFGAVFDCPGATVLSTSPERFLHVSAGGARGDAADQGHAPAGCGSRARCRAGAGAHREREGPRREPDDRRPDAQRSVAGVRARLGARLRALRARALRHGPPPRLDRCRPPRGRPRRASTCCAPRFPEVRSPALPSCGPWKSSPSWSHRGAVFIAARSATGARPARWTRSIAIRTALARDGRIYFSAGGGIVADSDPAEEYAETLDKARPSSTRSMRVLDRLKILRSLILDSLVFFDW